MVLIKPPDGDVLEVASSHALGYTVVLIESSDGNMLQVVGPNDRDLPDGARRLVKWSCACGNQLS